MLQNTNFKTYLGLPTVIVLILMPPSTAGAELTRARRQKKQAAGAKLQADLVDSKDKTAANEDTAQKENTEDAQIKQSNKEEADGIDIERVTAQLLRAAEKDARKTQAGEAIPKSEVYLNDADRREVEIVAEPEKYIVNPATVAAREALVAIGEEKANQQKEAIRIAVDVINYDVHHWVTRAALEPQVEQVEQLTSEMKKAFTFAAILKLLKELKAPLRALRVQQTLQDLLITGCYQDLLDSEERKEEVLNGDTREASAPLISKCDKLLKRIKLRLDNEEKCNTSRHLEDYIAKWTQFQKSSTNKTQEEVDIEVSQMRKDWRNTKHSCIENLGFKLELFKEALSSNYLVQSLDPSQMNRNLKAHAEFILDYLCDIISETAAIDYIDKEGLASSLEDIRKAIVNRTQEFVNNYENAWNYRVNPELNEQDVRRRELLANAILLGDKEGIKEHKKMVEEMIKTANKPVMLKSQTLLLPQLVEARIPRDNPYVRLEIVFDPSLTQEQKTKALEDLRNILPGSSEVLDRPIIKTSQATVHKNFCVYKDKLARLGVRVVLMGEYGLNEIKVRNRPELNRIYSQFGLEKADGFFSIPDFEEPRGQEPYFSPIGWRRVAVDIGLSDEEFSDRYGKILTLITGLDVQYL